MEIRPVEVEDLPWVRRVVRDAFASPRIVSGGVLHVATDLPGFLAEEDRAGVESNHKAGTYLTRRATAPALVAPPWQLPAVQSNQCRLDSTATSEVCLAP